MRRSNRLAEKQSAKLKNEDHEQPKAKKNRLDDKNFDGKAKKMRRSTRLAQNPADLENDAQMDPIVKKGQSENKTSNIVTLDNGTMVETLKYLNYMQLAKSSLVSKRYSNLIRTHRHSLSLLDVDSICMRENNRYAACMEVFNKKLSSKEYNEWIIHNRYSKQIPLNCQVEYGLLIYEMIAGYKDSNKTTWVFAARANLNHEKWPLFQHFVRLFTDPFIYIRYLKLAPRIDVSFINLLAKAMNPDNNRLQCNAVELFSNGINIEDNVMKLIGWIKNHVHCNKFRIIHDDISNYHEELLDLFVTGAHCTSAITNIFGDLSNVFKALLQKFMDLKNRDEYQLVESIRGDVKDQRLVEELKRNYAEFIAEEEQFEDIYSARHVIGFINNNIEKKLTLSVKNDPYGPACFSLMISNL